jgi:hypothetical protein
MQIFNYQNTIIATKLTHVNRYYPKQPQIQDNP